MKRQGVTLVNETSQNLPDCYLLSCRVWEETPIMMPTSLGQERAWQVAQGRSYQEGAVRCEEGGKQEE